MTLFLLRAPTAVLVALGALAGARADPYDPKHYACSVCEQILAAGAEGYEAMCSHLQACDMISAKVFASASLAGLAPLEACQRLEFCPLNEPWENAAAAGSVDGLDFDLRVTKGHGSRGYNTVRVSAITNASSVTTPYTLTRPDGTTGAFDYAAPFKYRWTAYYLFSAVVEVTPGVSNTIKVNDVEVEVKVPPEESPAKIAIIADPCFSSRWVNCPNGDTFQTFDRQTKFINVLSGGGDAGIDSWMILGDNFYDKDSSLSTAWFGQMSLEAKAKPFATAFGNHDYWVHGTPQSATRDDDYANGKMQFYAQDTSSTLADGANIFNFTVDPDKEALVMHRKPDVSNFVWYHKVGNVGFIGYSGAYTLREVEPYLREACEWMGSADNMPAATFLVGHWNEDGMGCGPAMDVPDVYKAMSRFPGCDAMGDSFRYVMGHVHCNEIITEDLGFMVAGQGMGGCTNFGVPVFDTSNDRVMINYFPLDTDDLWNTTYTCVQERGYSGCLEHAQTWLNASYQDRAAAGVRLPA